jgi:cell shape-determining protein MreC
MVKVLKKYNSYHIRGAIVLASFIFCIIFLLMTSSIESVYNIRISILSNLNELEEYTENFTNKREYQEKYKNIYKKNIILEAKNSILNSKINNYIKLLNGHTALQSFLKNESNYEYYAAKLTMDYTYSDRSMAKIKFNKNISNNKNTYLPVFGENGLYGKIINSSNSVGNVMLLDDIFSYTPVKIGGRNFIAKGMGKDNDLLIVNISKNVLQQKTLSNISVETSGLSGCYPEGFKIGISYIDPETRSLKVKLLTKHVSRIVIIINKKKQV